MMNFAISPVMRVEVHPEIRKYPVIMSWGYELTVKILFPYINKQETFNCEQSAKYHLNKLSFLIITLKAIEQGTFSPFQLEESFLAK